MLLVNHHDFEALRSLGLVNCECVWILRFQLRCTKCEFRVHHCLQSNTIIVLVARSARRWSIIVAPSRFTVTSNSYFNVRQLLTCLLQLKLISLDLHERVCKTFFPFGFLCYLHAIEKNSRYKMLAPYHFLKIDLNREKLMHASFKNVFWCKHAGRVHLCLKPFGSIMIVNSYPPPLPPWTMGFGPAITTSKSAGFHHLITDSRPWYKNPRQFPLSVLSESQTHLKDRYSPTELLYRAFVRHFTTQALKSHRLITPCRLITSSTTGYDGKSSRI